MKYWNLMRNIGMARYVVMFHDGKKKHRDGSRFEDVQIFSNRRDTEKFIKTLTNRGYVRK